MGQVKEVHMLEQLENPMMPKSENSIGAVNQQERDLAYVIGVYFGDGYVSRNYTPSGDSNTKYFRLQVIDKDFRDYTADRCERSFPERTTTKFTCEVNDRTYHCIQIRGIGNYLESVTGKKTYIPNFVYASDDNKKAFLEGMLDSEGWVQLQLGKKGTTCRATIGIAVTSEILYELKKMFESLNVKVGKVSVFTKNRKKPLKHINLNVESFVDSGMKFNIERKQIRIEAFRMIKELVQIASKIGRKLSDRSILREQTTSSLREMMCSVLCREVKRLSEMSSPAQVGE